MLSADEIARLARDYEMTPRGAVSTARTLREIEDKLLTGDNSVEVGVQCARMYEYLNPQWVRSAFLRSLEARTNAR